MDSNNAGRSADEENKMDLLKKGTYSHRCSSRALYASTA